jgi:hypothetical protein
MVQKKLSPYKAFKAYKEYMKKCYEPEKEKGKW